MFDQKSWVSEDTHYRERNWNENVTYTGEFVAREDSGCTKSLLNWDLYLICGEPRTESVSGNGFNSVINHLKLNDDNLQLHYKYIVGSAEVGADVVKSLLKQYIID